MVIDLLYAILEFLKNNPIVVAIIGLIIVADLIFTRKIWKFCTERSFGLLLCLFVICFIAFAEIFQDYLLPVIRKIYTLIGNQIYYVNIFDDGFRNVSLSIGGSITLSIAVLGIILTLIRNTLTRQQNNTDKERLVTEQISRAVEQTGAYKQEVNGANYQPNIEARLGGLYSLQRIMQKSPKDAQTIAKIFYAYVRENAKRPRTKEQELKINKNIITYQLPEDIQAAFSIICQFSKKPLLDSQLNFSRADFREYSFTDMDFSNAILKHVNLEDADLSDADLSGADLSGANLINTVMFYANLSGAILVDTDLEHALLTDIDANYPGRFVPNLSGANLSGASLRNQILPYVDLSGANLSRANLPNINLLNANLKNANLFKTNLFSAILRDADLSGANLEKTSLLRVDLFEVRNVTQEQINKAEGDEKTIPPKGLTRPPHWK